MSAIFGEGLPHRVTVYVPGTFRVSRPLSDGAHDELVNRVARFLSSLFGGATILPGRGAWVDRDGNLVLETITLVYAATDELSTDALQSVRQFAAGVAREFEQEAVAVEVDGTLYFVA